MLGDDGGIRSDLTENQKEEKLEARVGIEPDAPIENT